jgi:hypothetical protein
MESIGFWQSFHTRATRRAPDRPGGPPGSQSLATLPTGLRLATKLLKRALQVETLKSGVCPATDGMRVYIGVQGQFPRIGSGGSEELEGRAAATWPAGQLVPLTNLIGCHNILPRGLGNVPAKFGSIPCQLIAGQPAFEPIWPGFWSKASPWVVHASGVHLFVTAWSIIRLSPRKTPFNLPIGPMGWGRLGLCF